MFTQALPKLVMSEPTNCNPLDGELKDEMQCRNRGITPAPHGSPPKSFEAAKAGLGPLDSLLSLCNAANEAELRRTVMRTRWEIFKAVWVVATRRCLEEAPPDPMSFLRQHTGIYRLWGDAKPGETWLHPEECLASHDETKYELLMANPANQLAKLATRELRLNAVSGPEPFSFDLYDYGDSIAVDLPFDNTFLPESPFHHPEALKNNLQTLVAEVQKSGFNVEFVMCVTWLNALPRFLELFPAAYRSSVRPWTEAGPSADDVEGIMPVVQPLEWYQHAHQSVRWANLGAS